MILPVDYRKLDPYLTRLTALYPEGNTAAEVAARVSEMLGSSRSQTAHVLRPDVASKQLEAYRMVWSITGALPKWGQEGSRTYGDLDTLSQSLRRWYFKHAGGLFFTRASYSRYAELQNALESLDAPESAQRFRRPTMSQSGACAVRCAAKWQKTWVHVNEFGVPFTET